MTSTDDSLFGLEEQIIRIDNKITALEHEIIRLHAKIATRDNAVAMMFKSITQSFADAGETYAEQYHGLLAQLDEQVGERLRVGEERIEEVPHSTHEQKTQG